MKRARKTREIEVPCGPEEENVYVDDNRNPLLNNVVMNCVFEVIPFNFNDFKNFRLVSNLWLKESLGRWRKEVWLSLSCRSTSAGNIEPQFLPLQQFMKMLNLQNDPFGLVGKNHYKKYKVSISHDFPESDEFWSKIGSFMTHLKLSDFAFWKAPEAFVQIIFELTPNLTFLSLERNEYQDPTRVSNMLPYPFTASLVTRLHIPRWDEKLRPSKLSDVQKKLTHFQFTMNNSSSSDLEGMFGISWMYFFIRFPNIKVLKLQGFQLGWKNSGVTFDEVLKILTAVKTVRDNNDGQDCLTYLEHLDLLNARWIMQGRFLKENICMLEKLQFPLTSLALDIGYLDDKCRVLDKILKFYSKTLQKLTVFRGNILQPFSQSFPYGVELPVLTELRLIGPICRHLHFLKDVPQLKTLVLLNGYDKMEPEVLHSYVDYSLERLSDKVVIKHGQMIRPFRGVIERTNFSGTSLKNLVMPQMEELIVGHELCSEVQVKALGKLMPGLKKLRLGFGNDGFRRTCKNWTQLHHLDIQPFDVDEKGFLGIEKRQKYRQPNITDLKQLSYLRVAAHSSDSNKGGLSTASIVDGLFLAESLKKVKLTVTPKASKKVREMFAFKFP